MRVLLIVLLLLIPASALAQQGVCVSSLCVSEWLSTTPYTRGQMARFNQTVYVCVSSVCTGISPDVTGPAWNSLSGLRQWNASFTYSPGQMVMQNGTLFTALLPNTNQDPSSGTNPNWRTGSSVAPPTIFVTSATPTAPTGADIQAAITRAPVGGIVQLDCVPYSAVNATIPKRLILQGCAAGTSLNSSSGAVLTLTATESSAFDGAIVIRDMRINVGSGGTAIVGNPASQTRGNIFDNLTISGGSVGIDIQTNTSVNTILNSRFVGQTSYGVKLVNAAQGCEAGDNAIVASNFFPAANGSSGGVFVSVGGFRFIGSKVLDQASNNPRTHYGIRTETQCSTETLISASEIDQVDIPVSFGNCSLGGGCYGVITITGNYLRGTQNTISLVGASGGLTSYSSVSITGNVIDSILSGGTVIDLEQVLNSTITGNVINASTGWTTLRLKDSRFITWSSSNSMLSFDTTNPFNFVSGLSNVAIESSRTDLGNGFIFTLANLPTASGLNGSVMACSNCKNPTDGGFAAGVCASGGTGNNARRLNGAWVCS